MKPLLFGSVIAASLTALAGCARTSTMEKTVAVGMEMRAAPDKVFAYMADPAHAPSSSANIRGSGLGRTNDWTFDVAGKKISGHAVCVDYIANQRKVYAVYGDIDGTETYIFVPAPDGTRVVVIGTYFVPVPAATPDALKQAAIKHIRDFWEEYLKNVKDAVEV